MNVRIILRPQSQSDDYFHARALVRRDEHWHVCGVFQLLRREWLAFATVCAQFDIEITHEQATLSVDAAEVAALRE